MGSSTTEINFISFFSTIPLIPSKWRKIPLLLLLLLFSKRPQPDIRQLASAPLMSLSGRIRGIVRRMKYHRGSFRASNESSARIHAYQGLLKSLNRFIALWTEATIFSLFQEICCPCSRDTDFRRPASLCLSCDQISVLGYFFLLDSLYSTYWSDDLRIFFFFFFLNTFE